MRLKVNPLTGQLIPADSIGAVISKGGSSSGGGNGDVVGPSSSTDNAITRWDGTTGKLIQNSVVTVSDTGTVSTPQGYVANNTPGTYTSALSTALSQVGSFVLNYASPTFPVAVGDSTTISISQSQSPFFGGALFFAGNTIKNTSGIAANLGPYYGLLSATITTADAASISQTVSKPILMNNSFTTTGGGTLAVGSVSLFEASGAVGSGVTVTEWAGAVLGSPANSGTITTLYGLKVAAITTGSTNVGVGIGAAGTNTLWVNNTSDSTNVAGGAVFGSSKDTALYRDSAHTLAVYTGSTSVGANLGGTLDTNTTTVGNVGTGEDNLMSFSVGAGSLAANGEYIEFDAAGTIANNVNAKRIRIKFGATTIFDTGAAGIPVSTAIDWVISGKIIRTGATTQKCMVSMNTNNATLASYADYSTAAETLSGAVTLQFTGEAVSDNDIVQEIMTVKWQPDN